MRKCLTRSRPRASVEAWEDAYCRFETPDEDIAKFVKRLRAVGADAWSRRTRIGGLFCGRGSGLRALDRLGFSDLEGIDQANATLLRQPAPR